MRIVAINNNSWIQIDKIQDEYDYAPYSMKCFIDIGHSKFEALNMDLHLLNLTDFIKYLDCFILDRSIVPKLEGTYNTFVEFKAVGNSVIASFNIGSSYCGGNTHEFIFSGSFEIGQESLNTLVADLKGYA